MREPCQYDNQLQRRSRLQRDGLWSRKEQLLIAVRFITFLFNFSFIFLICLIPSGLDGVEDTPVPESEIQEYTRNLESLDTIPGTTSQEGEIR